MTGGRNGKVYLPGGAGETGTLTRAQEEGQQDVAYI